MGGYAKYTHDYSFHQRSFFGTGYTGYNGSSANANTVASAVKNVVLWGSNVLSTVNSSAYSEIRSVEMMKQRGGKVWFIGPEFVDTGVTLADTWYQMKPYTDTALILGMLYHAIDTTFDADGNKKTGGLLDVDYIDTMVYGFFDSPEYWIETNYTKGTDTAVGTDINENAGKIYIDQTTAKSEIDKWDKETGPFTIGRNTYPYRWKNKADTSLYVYQEPIVKVNAVPAGRSLSAYIMGSDARLTKAAYSGNYVADQFASKQAKRNGDRKSVV